MKKEIHTRIVIACKFPQKEDRNIKDQNDEILGFELVFVG